MTFSTLADGSLIVDLGRRRERRPALIGDRGALIELLEHIIKREGGKHRAAKVLDLSIAQLNRLLDPNHPAQRLNSDLYGRLQRKSGGLAGARMLLRALITPATEHALAEYDAWLKASLVPWGITSLLRHPYGEPRIFLPQPEARAWHALAPFYSSPGIRSHFLHFERKLVTLGYGDGEWLENYRDKLRSNDPAHCQHFLYARGVLALIRVIEPLVAGPAIELRQTELVRSGHALNYLVPAIERELALLNREPSLQRAQSVTSPNGSRTARAKR